MAKRKTGLHKEISSIFGGVSIPQNNNDAQQQLQTLPPEEASCAPSEPEVPNPQIPVEPEHQQVAVEPEHQQVPVEPEHQQVAQSPAKPPAEAAPVRQSKADVTIKTARRTPWRQTLQRIKDKSLQQIKDKFLAPKRGASTTRQKAMMVLVPVLFIIMIFVFTQVLSMPSHKVTESASFGPSKTTAGFTGEIDWQIPERYPTTLRDPMQFAPGNVAQYGTGELIVKGIVSSGDSSSAIIDNQIVREGEEILGATVVKINKDSVEFEKKGKSWKQRVQ